MGSHGIPLVCDFAIQLLNTKRVSLSVAASNAVMKKAVFTDFVRELFDSSPCSPRCLFQGAKGCDVVRMPQERYACQRLRLHFVRVNGVPDVLAAHPASDVTCEYPRLKDG
jgi:hypothetical protein